MMVMVMVDGDSCKQSSEQFGGRKRYRDRWCPQVRIMSESDFGCGTALINDTAPADEEENS